MPDLSRQHQRTLALLFSHPLPHGLRLDAVKGLLSALGAELHSQGSRLTVRFPAGPRSWIHAGGSGVSAGDLDAEAIARLRHWLDEAGVSPDHPQPRRDVPRGDQALRLVLVLDHRQSLLFRLEGEQVDRAVLRPHGLWGSGENLSHRHDRDIAGQRAPLDHAYLEQLAVALQGADAVLLLGHGQGESDMRTLLLRHLRSRHPALLQRIEAQETVDTSALSEAQLLALARRHFGNLPHRRPLVAPGQEPTPG
ncbi:MAG: hypothetical protein VKM98_05960 [Cyanobacteriota bacterium]|nr:hypothetical protein [Cyanobacteriota bacterium]